MADEVLDLCTVRLLALPIDVHRRATEHSDELMREFTYIRAQAGDAERPGVPARLLALMDGLQGRFGGFSNGPQTQIDEATSAGVASIDVVYEVPAAVGSACIQLGELLEEADRFCDEGTHLLTLVTPPEALAYRHWFLNEFVRQANGEAPTPWAPG